MIKQPYLYRPWIDWLFVLLPPFVCLFIVMLFPNYFNQSIEVAGYSWLILIVLIDVSHVYSTLFRTYLDKDMMSKFRSLFYSVPILVFVVGIMLFTSSQLLFWRILAYLAVFHFIRQQYGFLRLYSRKDGIGKLKRLIDSITIYSSTIYPLLYWHLSSDRAFNWFVKGDFLIIESPVLKHVFCYLYVLILLVYVVSEILHVVQNKYFNVPKNMVLIGTALSWLVGIVILNSDLSFTLLNVVAHGIPYMALVWMKAHQKNQKTPYHFSRFVRFALTNIGLPIFIAFMLVPALLEEGLWDLLIWHEQFEAIFGFEYQIELPKFLVNVIVPLLAVPQVTHYILDGFIWKVSKDEQLQSN